METPEKTLFEWYTEVKNHKYREKCDVNLRDEYFSKLYDTIQVFYNELSKNGIYPSGTWFGHEWNVLIGKCYNWGYENKEDKRTKPNELIDVEKLERIQSEIILGMIHCFLENRPFTLHMPHYYGVEATKEIEEYYYSPNVFSSGKMTYNKLNPVTYKLGIAVFKDNNWSIVKEITENENVECSD